MQLRGETLTTSCVALALAVFCLMLTPAKVLAHGDEVHDEEETEEVQPKKLKPRRLPRNFSIDEDTLERPSSSSSPSRVSGGFFITQDLSLISDDGLSPQVSSRVSSTRVSTTKHTPGDKHKASDGHDHHHAIVSRCPTATRCHAGEDHSVATPDSGGGSGTTTSGFAPVFNFKMGYRVGDALSFSLNVFADTVSGARDPGLGVHYIFPIATQLSGLVSLSATVPLTQASRDNAKFTTVTGSLITLYQSGSFYGGVGGFVSGSAYGDSQAAPVQGAATSRSVIRKGADPSGSTNHTHDEKQSQTQSAQQTSLVNRELVRTGGFLYLGTALTKGLSLTASAGLGSIYREEGDLGWVTDVTVARLAYGTGGLQGSVAFSLLSDSRGTDGLSAPSQPFLGFRLQYLFGEQSTIGIISNAQ